MIAMNDVLRALCTTLIESHCQPANPAHEHRLLHQSAALLHTAFAHLEDTRSTTVPEPLIEVLALIHRAPHSDLSNAKLATRAGLSVEKFIRAFREHTGQTPAAYVIATRVKAAEEALALTDKTIDQIAIESGFPNRHYFSRMFARSVGCGPAEFRARQWKRKGM